MDGQPHDFGSVKSRLEEIAEAVSDETMPLDEALDLFEEAVSLGLAVSDYVEEGIVVEEPFEGTPGQAAQAGDAGDVAQASAATESSAAAQAEAASPAEAAEAAKGAVAGLAAGSAE